MYETRKQHLLTRAQFAKRVFWHLLFVIGCAVISLAIGILGYHFLGALPWIDALLDASMILSGMGPVDPLKSDAAKVFASLYALYSGLFFIGVIAVLVVPFVHRIMHKIHIDEEGT
ncbi:MAG TPA: hypothetical protein VGR95_02265 [Thermoanaerobaculia bacterium]|jgi:hypothetical protein|nr:hypothetical protein [Thermoanaerobaculia bacterium]